VFASPVPVAAAPEAPLTVTADAAGRRVETNLDGCPARLVQAEAGGPFTYANSCRQDTQGRVQLLVRMLDAALADPAERGRPQVIEVESVHETFPDFARRLAQQAARAPEWHGERARRDAGFAAQTALRFANTPPIYRELQEALRPLRFTVRIAQLDAVKVAPPPETPFADWLADRGIDARRALPYDARVIFRLSPS
jgi:hypothetical protein